MKDRDRKAAIDAALRLSNWFQRSRLSPAEFIERHRASLDELIESFQSPRQRRWRRWEDLPEWKRARLQERFIRQAQTRTVMPTALSSRGIVGKLALKTHRKHADYLHIYNMKHRTLIRIQKIAAKEGTIEDRLLDKRMTILRNIVDYGGTIPEGRTSLVADLHPDDAELVFNEGSLRALVVDRAFRKFAPLFHDKTRETGKRQVERPLAATLFIRDVNDQVEVWYCALVTPRRSTAPTLDRLYVGRVTGPGCNGWRVTGRYKTGAGALTAARKLYGEILADHIHRD